MLQTQNDQYGLCKSALILSMWFRNLAYLFAARSELNVEFTGFSVWHFNSVARDFFIVYNDTHVRLHQQKLPFYYAHLFSQPSSPKSQLFWVTSCQLPATLLHSRRSGVLWRVRKKDECICSFFFCWKIPCNVSFFLIFSLMFFLLVRLLCRNCTYVDVHEDNFTFALTACYISDNFHV